MTAVHFDPSLTDEERRGELYAGSLVVLPPTDASLALCTFAREMIEEAFAPHDPREAQYHMPVEDFVARFAPVKPAFIHHPRTMSLLAGAVAAHGCDLDDTYVDVPRLRGVTSGGYLTSGVGYAHHPHRDTWYSAPLAQLNWWLPIYPFTSDSAMAFHPRYFHEGVANGSSQFNYYEWNAVGRKDAAKQIGADTRKQPKAEEHVALEPDIRLVVPVGGTVLFSAAQMHSTVANTSGLARFSIDFRTVNLRDLVDGRSAPNVDSAPQGTSLRDFRRGHDLAAMPEAVVAQYDDAASHAGVLVFRPEA